MTHEELRTLQDGTPLILDNQHPVIFRGMVVKAGNFKTEKPYLSEIGALMDEHRVHSIFYLQISPRQTIRANNADALRLPTDEEIKKYFKQAGK